MTHRFELPWVVNGATFGGKEADLHDGYLLIDARLRVVGWRCAPHTAIHPRNRIVRGLCGPLGDAGYWGRALDEEAKALLMAFATQNPGFRSAILAKDGA